MFRAGGIHKRLSLPRDRLVAILARYANEIMIFVNSNPGLQSRFNPYIQFDDYNREELCEIFKLSLKKSEYKIKKNAFEALGNHINYALYNKDEHFGNGRFVRNLFERVIQNQANRLAKCDTISDEDLSIITIDDIPS